MSFATSYELARNAASSEAVSLEQIAYEKQVMIAMAKVATQVQGEAQGSLTLQQWQKRATLAVNVVTDLETWLSRFKLAVVASNASITSSSTDADVEFQVNAIWDDMAGVTGQDLT